MQICNAEWIQASLFLGKLNCTLFGWLYASGFMERNHPCSACVCWTWAVKRIQTQLVCWIVGQFVGGCLSAFKHGRGSLWNLCAVQIFIRLMRCLFCMRQVCMIYISVHHQVACLYASGSTGTPACIIDICKRNLTMTDKLVGTILI
jgi:hypothetical protein